MLGAATAKRSPAKAKHCNDSLCRGQAEKSTEAHRHSIVTHSNGAKLRQAPRRHGNAELGNAMAKDGADKQWQGGAGQSVGKAESRNVLQGQGSAQHCNGDAVNRKALHWHSREKRRQGKARQSEGKAALGNAWLCKGIAGRGKAKAMHSNAMARNRRAKRRQSNARQGTAKA